VDSLQEGSPIGRFIEGILPDFLRGDHEAQAEEPGADAAAAADREAREQRRARLDELRRRKAEREGVLLPEEE
jgi:penicillin-binding protein 1A